MAQLLLVHQQEDMVRMNTAKTMEQTGKQAVASRD